MTTDSNSENDASAEEELKNTEDEENEIEVDEIEEGTEVNSGGNEDEALDVNVENEPAEAAVIKTSDDQHKNDEEEKEEITPLVKEDDSEKDANTTKISDSNDQGDIEQGAIESTEPPSSPDPLPSSDAPPETTATTKTEASTTNTSEASSENPSCLIIGVGTCLVAAIIALIVGIVIIAREGGDNDKISTGASSPPSRSPVTAPTFPETESPTASPETEQPMSTPTTTEPTNAPTRAVPWQLQDPRVEELVAIYEELNLDWATFATTSEMTPQLRALEWILLDSSSPIGVEDTRQQLFVWDDTTIVRYALATFYYATYATPNKFIMGPSIEPWQTSQDLWLTSASACEWYGISCNQRNEPTSLELWQNGLTGSIPIELAFLGPYLQTLDLSSNFIHVAGDGFAVFGYLPQLRYLDMDDNFLEYAFGLPASFTAMTNLERIRLSYNLLSGGLPTDVLASLTKLNHLELEFNFLSGTLPPGLAKLSELVYIYLRNNLFETTLDAIPFLPNLFALWLDNNDVVGPIPPGFGALTNLASLSIANTALSGTIPSELGNLTNLRRIWLYSNLLEGTIPSELLQLTRLQVLELHDNNLVGTMPTGICTTVSNSDYPFSSLTSDCVSEFECVCCTQCF